MIACCARCARCSLGGGAGLAAACRAVRLAEAHGLIGELTAQVERLSARLDELERRGCRDSSTSSRARASYGPETCAQAANLVCGHHIPIWRSTLVLCLLAGAAVSTGWTAGIRGRAAALIGVSGFIDRIRELLRAAPAVHADETPARAAGGTRYVHLACTAYLTLMHTSRWQRC